MSNISIGAPRLPRARRGPIGETLARQAVFRLLGALSRGSLVLHEGAQRHHFGGAGNALEPSAEVHIHNPAAYAQVLSGGSVGAGEAYMQGSWSSPSLVEVTRLFSANLAVLEGMEAGRSRWAALAPWLAHRRSRNTRRGSRKNIAAHYDLGNEFFRLFLDPTMMYSAALFDGGALTLEAASEAKLDELCRQLELQPDDHLLEIGAGWGGMAIHAAKYFGCRVTTTTISREQFEYTRARIAQEGLESRITVLCEDYRNLAGEYDKLVSIEMIEAVGHEFYGDYFRRCAALLKPAGRMAIQAITVSDQRYAAARDQVDFIKRYIFPGGCLPSIAVIADHVARHTDLRIVHLRDITADYATTLAHWRERFLCRLDVVRAMGFSEEFARMWEYYLCYCEGGFREYIIGTVQLSLVKPGYRRPA